MGGKELELKVISFWQRINGIVVLGSCVLTLGCGSIHLGPVPVAPAPPIPVMLPKSSALLAEGDGGLPGACYVWLFQVQEIIAPEKLSAVSGKLLKWSEGTSSRETVIGVMSAIGKNIDFGQVKNLYYDTQFFQGNLQIDIMIVHASKSSFIYITQAGPPNSW